MAVVKAAEATEAADSSGGADDSGGIRPRPAGRERLVGVDVARGIAILGVFIAHMGVPLTALLVGSSDSMEPFFPDYEDAGFRGTVVSWVETAVSGRSAALFAFLAGLALVLVAGRRRPEAREDRNRIRVKIAVRAVVLIAIGYALATLGSLAVILHFYGLYFLLAIPLLWLRRRHLVAIGVAVLLVGPLLASGAYSSVLPWDAGGYESELDAKWEEKAEDPEWLAEQEALDAKWEAKWDDPEWLAEQEAKWEAELADAPLFDLETLETPVDLLLDGIYPAVVYMAYVIAGMLVGRLDLKATRIRLGLVGSGVGLAVAGYGSSALLLGPLSGLLPSGEEDPFYWSLLSAGSHDNTAFEVIGNIGVAMAVLGLCLLVADRARVLLYPLATAGAMTLTLYTAHGVGLWAVSRSSPDAVWATYLQTYTVEIFIVVGLVFAVLWRRFLGAGPMERPLTWTANTVSRRLVPRAAATAPSPTGPSGPDHDPGPGER